MTHSLPLHVTAAIGVFKSAFAALVAGSRIIPLGDNGKVIKDLAASRDPFRKA